MEEKKYYRIVIDVQLGDMLDKCNKLYDGEGYDTIYSDRNGEAVIDYLKQWDSDSYNIDDIREEEPNWCNNGTDYVYTKDGYTLLYNSTIGGVYMLYRDATEDEIIYAFGDEEEDDEEEEEELYPSNYSVAVHWCNNHYILCNNLPNIDSSVYDNIRYPKGCEPEECDEIFQWFLSDCSGSDVEYLMKTFPGLVFTYSDVLDLYVLCVNHYGTSWQYVYQATTNEYATAKLGYTKEQIV